MELSPTSSRAVNQSLQPSAAGVIVFYIACTFLGVGLFLLFVLDAGKTMVRSFEELLNTLAVRHALKQTKKQAVREILP